jgi:hypothetical protein
VTYRDAQRILEMGSSAVGGVKVTLHWWDMQFWNMTPHHLNPARGLSSLAI